MKCCLKYLILLMFISASAGSAAVVSSEDDPDRFKNLARYDLIVRRDPFGMAREPSGGGTGPDKTEPVRDSVLKYYKIIAITESGLGVKVGLVDLRIKPVRAFFMLKGDTIDGLKLVDADFDEEKALLREGGEEKWLTMGSGRGGSTVRAPRGLTASERANLKNVQNLIKNRKSMRGRLKPFKVMSRDEYKKLRAQGKMPAPTPASRALKSQLDKDFNILSKSEKEAYYREYNMNLIRAGGDAGVPLPIKLTPEEDAKLVQEGVLAPSE